MAVGSQISTLSNAYKAYMAWNTGIMYDSYGRKLTAEMDKTAIVSMILGFTPQTYEDLGVSFQKAQWRKDIIRNGVEDILNLQRKYTEATDEKTKQELQNAVNLRFLSFEKDGIADDIVKDVNREMQSQGMIQNMIYRQQLQAMPEGEE
jgi:arginyl-tRNA synthetase